MCAAAEWRRRTASAFDDASILSDGGRSGSAGLAAAGLTLADIGTTWRSMTGSPSPCYAAEEIGFAPRGAAAPVAADGEAFGRDGRRPLNTHGGLLSYGHCGVAGAMAHLVEAFQQMTGRSDARQIAPPETALAHADGGVLSSHVSLVLERAR